MVIADVNYTRPVPNSNRVLMNVSLNCTNQEEANDIYRTLQRMSGNERPDTQYAIIDRNQRPSHREVNPSEVRSFRSLADAREHAREEVDGSYGAEVVDMMGNEQAPTQFIEIVRPIARPDLPNPQISVDNKSSDQTPSPVEVPKTTNPIEDLEIN